MQSLFTRFSFSPDAARYCITGQKLSTIDSVLVLDEHQVEQICKACRKPGGLIPNPDYVSLTDPTARAAFTGPTTITNPGMPISIKEEANLKLVSFFLKFKQMTSRPVTPTQVTTTLVNELQHYKKEIEKHENPLPETAPALTAKKIFDFFSDFRDYLHEHLGAISKRPLSYVIRENVQPPNNPDPGFGEPNTKYHTRYLEIEQRAPIEVNGTLDPAYIQDNVTVWKLLWRIVKDTQYVTYVKPYVNKQDGREAFKMLYTTLLGPQAVNNHASQAENRLAAMTLEGTRKKNWGFDKYVIGHKEQHLILDKLKKHGHSGVDENSKVRLFLQGISDPKLQPMISTLSTLRTHNFDDVVSSFRSFIETNKVFEKGPTRSLNISQVGTTHTSYKRKAGGSKSGPKDDNYVPGTDYSKWAIDVRYYKTPEWNAKQPNQRNYLREEKRKSAHKSVANTADLKRTIKALQAQVAQAHATEVSEDSSEEIGGLPIKREKKLKTLKRGNRE